MTLFRQLFLGASLAFFLVLGAIEGIYVQNAHKYLQEQLSSHAQDAATSLGIVLPVAMADSDLVRAEVTVNAIFDRGYYQSIRVLDTKGETLILKTLPVAPTGVPQWFVNLLPIEAPFAESLISKGWRQMGRVVVSSHPNFAYKQLWHTLWEATLGLALIYLLVLAALHSFLSRILRPLREIESVAHAITRRDFRVIKTVVGARELRSVVSAINSMSEKLQGMIEHEVRQATRFRDESNTDALTGLDNRRGFARQVHSLLEGAADLNSGALFLVQIDNFQYFNASRGFQEGDGLLKVVAEALKNMWAERNVLRARITGATYALMIFNITREDAVRLGDELSAALLNVIEVHPGMSEIAFGCGGIYFAENSVTLSVLMAQCDMAMLQSQTNGKSRCVLTDFSEEKEEEGRGSQFWKQLIVDALQAERIALLAQPVMGFSNVRPLQIEVMGRLKTAQGELIAAGQFIPMANRHQLTAAIDMAILKRLFKWMAADPENNEVAINLSIHSVRDETLRAWLSQSMRAEPVLASRLIFEFTEFGLAQDQAVVERFVEEIRQLGAEFAVDHFGLHRTAFEYLRRLKPSYVKLSPSYIRELNHHLENQFFISSVVKITHSLEIKVVALGVEEDGVIALLKQLGVDGYQGYISGEPKLLDC